MWQKLLTWLKSLFSVKAEEPDPYRLKERVIFSFWDGEKTVWIDPIATYKKMAQFGPEIDNNVAIISAPFDLKGNAAEKAHDELADRVRSIFGIKPFEQGKGGLTDTEAILVLDRFVGWCDELKKNSNRSPTSLTATSASSASSSAASPPTSSTSESGSTATAPRIEGQPQSSGASR